MNVILTENDLSVKSKLKLWDWFPGVWLPARLGGDIVVNPENNDLTYELDDVRVVCIPLAGLLKLIHIKLPLLLSIDRPGAQLEPYALALDHNEVFPPPAIGGKVASARIDEAGLYLAFDDNSDVRFENLRLESDSYLWIQSGDPKLFGVVVTDGGVRVTGEDTTSPLQFNLYEYRKQVSEGIIKMTETGGIIAVIPSY